MRAVEPSYDGLYGSNPFRRSDLLMTATVTCRLPGHDLTLFLDDLGDPRGWEGSTTRTIKAHYTNVDPATGDGCHAEFVAQVSISVLGATGSISSPPAFVEPSWYRVFHLESAPGPRPYAGSCDPMELRVAFDLAQTASDYVAFPDERCACPV